MAQPAGTRSESEFSWSGSLAETSVPAIYDRLQRLRLTGRLVLMDGARRSEVLWIGGQPLSPDGQGEVPPRPTGFVQGTFEVTQRVPDLGGQLTEGVELSGELVPGRVQRLFELCADCRLSAEVQLAHASGTAAQVRFTHGRFESASVDGAEHMALQALALLSAWRSGTFRLRLRPLFGSEAPAFAPIFIEKRTQKGDFDLTGAMTIPQEILPPRPIRVEPPRNLPPRAEPPPAPGEPVFRSALPTQKTRTHAPPPRRRPLLWAVALALIGGGLACALYLGLHLYGGR
jgi:hypothetical protein